MTKQARSSVDRPTFLIAAFITLTVGVLLWIFPEEASEITLALHEKILGNLGFIYSWMGLIVVALCLYFSFSRYGKIKFGRLDEKPEFSNFTWAASLFTAGIAASILYWSAAEWAYYYADPALGVEPVSEAAAEWSMAYGLFHWTVTPWAFNVLCALPIGYSYFVRKKPVFKISEVCREILGDRVDGWLGKGIDVFFMVSVIMGLTTDLGTGVPVISSAFGALFGVNVGVWGNRLVVLIITVLFTFACLAGLKKGIAKLGQMNTILAIVLLAIVLVFGPTMFIINMSTTGAGLLAQNFILMMTWMDPMNGGAFPQNWTQFYWAWWLSCGPLWGMFIARISRGRSIKNVYLGSILFGSLGCALFFAIMGSFEMNLFLTGSAGDFIEQVTSGSGGAAIVEGIETLPDVISTIALVLIAVTGILFAASSMDSMTFCFASTSMKRIGESESPKKWLIVAWAAIGLVIPTGFFGMSAGDRLQALKSSTIVASLPVCFIMLLEMWSFVRMVKNDRYFEEILCSCDDSALETLRARHSGCEHECSGRRRHKTKNVS